jgi:hypothetical protein
LERSLNIGTFGGSIGTSLVRRLQLKLQVAENPPALQSQQYSATVSGRGSVLRAVVRKGEFGVQISYSSMVEAIEE